MKFLLQSTALAAVIATSGAANAALTVYTSDTTFNAATTATGVDTFNNFPVGGISFSPMTRSAGAYSYTGTTSPGAPPALFYGAGTSADSWLAPNSTSDSMIFSGFSSSIGAIGGNFFGTGFDGLYAAGGITLVATDSLGATSTVTIANPTTSTFYGFSSTGTIKSLAVSLAVPNDYLWPTLNNLTLGQVAAVPEPETFALLLVGLSIVGSVTRRRRAGSRELLGHKTQERVVL